MLVKSMVGFKGSCEQEEWLLQREDGLNKSELMFTVRGFGC